MRKNLYRLGALLAAMAMSFSANAQKLHYNAGIETTHLWRGLEVSKGLTFNNEFSLSDNNNHFRVGLWGGMQINGNYKEFDYYLNYNNSGFNVAVWDIYNFSDGIYSTDKAYRIGNYNCHNTGHFIYSSWVQAGYTLYNDDKFKVDASVAGAFALNNYKENDDANFYGKTTGINDVRLSCTYKLKIGNHPLPITSQAMWNPEANKGYFRVAVNLLDL